jgi:hypothetical protein
VSSFMGIVEQPRVFGDLPSRLCVRVGNLTANTVPLRKAAE